MPHSRTGQDNIEFPLIHLNLQFQDEKIEYFVNYRVEITDSYKNELLLVAKVQKSLTEIQFRP